MNFVLSFWYILEQIIGYVSILGQIQRWVAPALFTSHLCLYLNTPPNADSKYETIYGPLVSFVKNSYKMKVK